MSTKELITRKVNEKRAETKSNEINKAYIKLSEEEIYNIENNPWVVRRRNELA